MSTGRAPLAVVRAGIAVHTRLVPSAPTRARYRAEVATELHRPSASAQLLLLVGLLGRILALRAALMPRLEPAREGATAASPSAGLWRCRLQRWHEWRVRSTEDGGRHDECRRGGVDRGRVGHGPLTTPPWPGHR